MSAEDAEEVFEAFNDPCPELRMPVRVYELPGQVYGLNIKLHNTSPYAADVTESVVTKLAKSIGLIKSPSLQHICIPSGCSVELYKRVTDKTWNLPEGSSLYDNGKDFILEQEEDLWYQGDVCMLSTCSLEAHSHLGALLFGINFCGASPSCAA